jgi:hypothetical protein
MRQLCVVAAVLSSDMASIGEESLLCENRSASREAGTVTQKGLYSRRHGSQ